MENSDIFRKANDTAATLYNDMNRLFSQKQFSDSVECAKTLLSTYPQCLNSKEYLHTYRLLVLHAGMTMAACSPDSALPHFLELQDYENFYSLTYGPDPDFLQKLATAKCGLGECAWFCDEFDLAISALNEASEYGNDSRVVYLLMSYQCTDQIDKIDDGFYHRLQVALNDNINQNTRIFTNLQLSNLLLYGFGGAPQDIGQAYQYTYAAAELGSQTAKEELNKFRKTLFGRWVYQG